MDKPNSSSASHATREIFGLDSDGWVEVSPQTAIRLLNAEIERLRSVYHWIPVSERLPDVLTEVLGWHPDDRVRAWFRMSGTVQGGPRQGDYWEMWSPQDRECDDCKVKEPTHWMPLPEPPEQP